MLNEEKIQRQRSRESVFVNENEVVLFSKRVVLFI